VAVAEAAATRCSRWAGPMIGHVHCWQLLAGNAVCKATVRMRQGEVRGSGHGWMRRACNQAQPRAGMRSCIRALTACLLAHHARWSWHCQPDSHDIQARMQLCSQLSTQQLHAHPCSALSSPVAVVRPRLLQALSSSTLSWVSRSSCTLGCT
jgi:hypothetical protein